MGIKILRHITRILIIALIVASVLTLLPTASAGVDKVICVPWQGDIAKYHTTWDGYNVYLKGVIKTDSTAQIWYKWNFGDGTSSSVSSTSGKTQYNVEVRYVYTGAEGTPFTAKLIVADNDALANPIEDPYLIKIEAANLDSEINVAIDNGLWYLYKTQFANSNTHSFDGSPVTVWGYSSYYASPTASAVHAFEINGHKETGNPDEDPYVESVERGLNWLFNGYFYSTSYPMLRPYNIGMVHGSDNPDTNGNGKGIEVRDYGYRPIYEGGMIMDAIIASGTPDADSGRDFDGDGFTETYREVVQDMCDMYAWGQYDDIRYGGWRYSWNQWPDNSACQWAAIGMIPAQEPPWNCDVPEWVKTYDDGWLTYSHYQWNSGLWGGFGYTSPSWGDALTPSGMVQLDFVGKTTDDPRWVRCERWFSDGWKDRGRDWLDRNNVYAYYAFAKAMRLAKPDPVVTFSDGYFAGLDWYRGGVVNGATTMGLAEKISNQLVSNSYWDYYGRNLGTAWCVIILKPVLFAEAPIACFDADPNPSFPDVPISFDPSCSDHSEPGKDIDNLVLFEWDWDDDGVYDEATITPEIVTQAFSCPSIPCTYPVTLRVTDDNVPARTATSVMNIEITEPPHPGVSVTEGPYLVSLCPDDKLILKGTDSYDPDEGTHQSDCDTCPDDTITAWDWDLTGAPWDFTDISGEIVTIDDMSAYFDTPGTYDIGLRVTDNTAAAYPASGQPDLTDETFTVVTVCPTGLCFPLTIEVGCQYVTISWDDVGADQYVIYKSTAGPNAGFEDVATTTETSKTMGSFVMGQTTYYRVMAITDGNPMALSRAVEVYADPELCNPTANPGGPYEGCVDEAVTLDGSGSTALVGTIVAWDWDLDNDGEYDDAFGETVEWAWDTEGTYNIGLKVTSSDSLTLTDEASTTVTIETCVVPQPELCPDEYQWGSGGPGWDPYPTTFVGSQEVHFVNNGPGDAFNVVATVTCVPINVVASDPDVTIGDIPAGDSAWSSDTFELRVDMTNPQDPNKGICWRVEYDDAAGVHHVFLNVAKFCGETCSDICP